MTIALLGWCPSSGFLSSPGGPGSSVRHAHHRLARVRSVYDNCHIVHDRNQGQSPGTDGAVRVNYPRTDGASWLQPVYWSRRQGRGSIEKGIVSTNLETARSDPWIRSDGVTEGGWRGHDDPWQSEPVVWNPGGTDELRLPRCLDRGDERLGTGSRSGAGRNPGRTGGVDVGAARSAGTTGRRACRVVQGQRQAEHGGRRRRRRDPSRIEASRRARGRGG